MPQLDLFSLSALGGVLALVMGLVLLAVRRAYPRNVDGMLLWSLAPIVGAAAPLLFVLGHEWSPRLTTAGGHALLLATALLFYFGSLRFLGHTPAWKAWLAFVGVVMALVVAFLFIWPDFRARLLVFGVGSVVISGLHARLLWRSGSGFAARFTAAVLGAKVAMLAARATATWLSDLPTTTFLTPSPAQLVYFASYSVSALLMSLGVILMVSERLRQEFEQLASHDGLTGALTRRAAEDALRHEFERWQRYGQPFAVLLFDIDHFKHVNDSYGHQAGDRVLIEVVSLANQSLRSTDRLGRYGGEEFLVVLPETRLDAAIQAAERIRRAVDGRVHTRERPACSVSVGVAAMGDGETVEALLARVDAALYRAKAAGRNRVAWDGRQAAENPPQPEIRAA